jgi:hypothetical protein
LSFFLVENMESERIPGFTAVESLKEKTGSYQLNAGWPHEETIILQFSLRSFICGAAITTCLVQPETCELLVAACDFGEA